MKTNINIKKYKNKYVLINKYCNVFLRINRLFILLYNIGPIKNIIFFNLFDFINGIPNFSYRRNLFFSF